MQTNPALKSSLLALTLLSVTSLAASADVVLTGSVYPSNPVVPGPNDISNVAPATGAGDYINYPGGNNGVGESFTIGNSDMKLTSVSLGLNGGSTNPGAQANFDLAIYAVGAGNSLTPVAGYANVAYTGTYPHPETTDFITFTLTGSDSLLLSANTTYAFQIAESDSGNYYQVATGGSQPSDATAIDSFDAHAFDGSFADGSPTTFSNLIYTYTFNIGLAGTAASTPEPSTYALACVGFIGLLLARRRVLSLKS